MIQPMLCQAGNESDLKRRGWISELKLDGTRGLVIKENGKVRIQNRHGVDYTRRLPEIVEAAQAIPKDFTMDGEIVYLDPERRDCDAGECSGYTTPREG